MNKLVSTCSHSLFVATTNYRNAARPKEVYARRIQAECVYAGIAVLATSEVVSRVILSPFFALPMMAQTTVQREAYFNRTFSPVARGIYYNTILALFSVIALAFNPGSSALDFRRIGESMWLIPREG